MDYQYNIVNFSFDNQTILRFSFQALEERVQTIVKMNFEPAEGNKDKSFRSSVDNIETEEKTSALNSKRHSYLESVASCSSLSINSLRPLSSAIYLTESSAKTRKIPTTHR